MTKATAFFKEIVSPIVVAGALLTGSFASPVSAQQVTNPNPAVSAEEVEPTSPISASFKPINGQAVVPNTVKVFVDDEDVTAGSVITGDFFSYRPTDPLSPGEHTVLVEFENDRGVLRRVTWSFEVGTPITATIESVVHNAGSRPLAAGEILLTTVTGTPASDVTVFLIQDGRQVQTLVTDEVSSGTYVANVLVEAKDSTEEGIVVARLENSGQVRFATAEQPAQLIQGAETETQTLTSVEIAGDGDTSGGSLTPRLTSHENGDRITGRSFTLSGETLPNATVQVLVDAERSVGGFVSAKATIVDQAVQADANGRFSLAVTPLAPTSGTVYNITMQATSGDQSSQRVTLQLTQQ